MPPLSPADAASSPPSPLPAGATLGMLGGGQLGRMFIQAAHRLGYRVHVLSPDADGPAGQIADAHTAAAYDDTAAVAGFARQVDAVTYEFENVPAAAAEAAADHAPVFPGRHVLHTAQHRAREKQTLHDHGLPVTPFRVVESEEALRTALADLGTPAVLKTSTGGYDGKGQRVIRSGDDPAYAWLDLGGHPCILEAMLDFEQEVSIVAARDQTGQTAAYGPIANTHRNHILDVSVLPSGLDPDTAAHAAEIAQAVMTRLDVVGVLCVECFVLRNDDPYAAGHDDQPALGRIVINELAPRPHNSGHLTIEACPASQFEQQVRAVAGLPLGEATPTRAAAMVNLLGDLWYPDPEGAAVDPPFQAVLDHAGPETDLHLHLYGKASARPGRKMGHLTALARTPHEALRDAVEARSKLT